MTVLAKDLRIELRSGEIFLTTTLFALLVVLLSAFAFNLNSLSASDVSSGVLWIAIAFSGLLSLSRTYAREREFGVWNAMLLAPIESSALFLGKALGVLVLLLLTEAVLLPIIQLFFHAPLLDNLLSLLPILLLGTLGYALVGTLFAAMTVRTRLKELLLGVILYPLIAPILISGVKATGVILSGEGLAAAADYLRLLVVIDVLYGLGGLWLFGTLMED